jgi:hypothetical protein
MLNPSTADETHDDPTIRRCIDFSRRWGFGSLEVVNLFALRATCPRILMSASDPIGPYNDDHILAAAGRANLLIAAWGIHGDHLWRAQRVAGLLESHRVRCLGLTSGGQPRHPLYVPATTPPIRWNWETCSPSRRVPTR